MKTEIEIERLISWAIGHSKPLPWRCSSIRELMIDFGLTARPRKRPMLGWAVAEAYGGMRLLGLRPGPQAHTTPVRDAALVLAAIHALPERRAIALVRVCGRNEIRPDWMPGIVPQLVERSRRCGRRHRRIKVRVWEPCSPETIRAARDAYALWWRAIATLADELDGMLDAWEISSILPPVQPWREAA